MKLDFKKAKRKLFGNSPGKSKKKRGVRSGRSNGINIICVVLIFAFLIAFTPMLLSDIDLITTNKKITTTNDAVEDTDNQESVFGLRRLKESMTHINDEPLPNIATEEDIFPYCFDVEGTLTINNITFQITKMSCLLSTTNLANTGTYKAIYYYALINGESAFEIVYMDDHWIDEVFNIQFTITNTNGLDEWLLANTEPVEDLSDEAETITLKAGTYRFNDFLPFIEGNTPETGYTQQIDFTFVSNQVEFTNPDDITTAIFYPNVTCYVTQLYQDPGGSIQFDYSYTVDGITYSHSTYLYGGDSWSYANAATAETIKEQFSVDAPEGFVYMGEGIKYATLITDQVVVDTFGSWFISNTNYNEVNAAQTAELEEEKTVILNPVAIQYLYCFDLKRNFANMAA